MSLCGIPLRRARFPCFRSVLLSREGLGGCWLPFRVDRQVSAGSGCHHCPAVQHGVGIVRGCVYILHDCLDASVAVGRGIGTGVVGFLVRCGWVGGCWCLMLDGGRRWGGRAVVWIIAWRGFRAVLRVDKTVVVAVVGLSE